MLNFSIIMTRVFMIASLCVIFSGCFFSDLVNSWLGVPAETVYNHIDLNKDGEITPEEIKASKYDLNKDGILSLEEMEKATGGSDLPSTLLTMAGVLGVPFAGILGITLKSIKKNKGHVRSIAGGIEDLIKLKQDGITKDDIYSAIKISAEKRGDAVALHKMVGEIKDDIRMMESHIKPIKKK